MSKTPVHNQGFALKLLNNESASFAERLTIKQKSIPSLKPGEVLVKILAAPVNPSDLVYLLGKYGIPPQDGLFAGFEACGQVLQANAGLMGKWLVGKRVALFASPNKDGLWAEYAVTKINLCIPLRKELSNEQAATLVVNPCTAVCLVERARELGSQALLINAAASQVGKSAIRYAKRLGLKTIATVRSKANQTALQELGCDSVLLTGDDDFDQQLKQAVDQLKPRVLLDAVADLDTPKLLKPMPNGSTAIIYGRLTETHNPIGGYFSVADVIFRDIKIEGFWLAHWVKTHHPLKVMQLTRKVQKLFKEGVFSTDILGCYGFDQFAQMLDHYAQHKSDGKILFCPDH